MTVFQLRKYVFLIVFFLMEAGLYSDNFESLSPPSEGKKVEQTEGLIDEPAENQSEDTATKISVTFYINKIYDVDTLSGSFSLDGYLLMSWQDDRNGVKGEAVSRDRMYENVNMDLFMEVHRVWFPYFEFLNILGHREVSNKRLIITPDGYTTYNERFNAVFHNQMDFRKFPFDSQTFSLKLELFSYDSSKAVFEYKDIGELTENGNYLEGWDITGIKHESNDVTYEHLSDKEGEPLEFSRLEYEIFASRLSGYYIWQVFFPLFLIIISSWVVFWLKEFSDQLATSFTLMLTVVAFNFYSASFLPQLPYNTFIESIIMSGYILIFLIIITIVFYKVLKDRIRFREGCITILRIAYPFVSIMVFAAVIIGFFVLEK